MLRSDPPAQPARPSRLARAATRIDITAAVLAALSLGLMAVRARVLGDEVRVPTGPGTWRVRRKISIS